MNYYRVDYSDIERAEGICEYMHNSKCISSGAFDINDSAAFRILLPRFVGVVSVFAEIYNESFTVKLNSFYGKLIPCEGNYDSYIIPVNVKSLGVGLYFVKFIFNTVCGKVFGYYDRGKLKITKSCNVPCHYQMTVFDYVTPYADKYLGGVIYHVFVDRFAKGGNIRPRKDAIMLEPWDGGVPEYPEYPGAHLENNTFFGGTLYGVIEKLDYIKSLGANLIYLSPIFEAYSNHKYDTSDYMKVDDMFGGDEALSLLIKEAEKRGIGIILDGVFNHTGSISRYFNKDGRYDSVGAYQSIDSPYYKWYDFQTFPNKYTCWWGIEVLPRIHPDVKECGDFIAGDGGVIDKYSKMGIAGIRLDVADELSDAFLSRIKEQFTKNQKKNIVFGEVWEDASNKIAYNTRKRYYQGKELDAVMNYPFRVGIIDYLKNKKIEALSYALTEVTFNAPVRVQNMQMNLLGTHDTERIITILAGASAEGKTNAQLAVTYLSDEERIRGIRLVKNAYTILATLPGIPTIFYGDEVGLEGYKDPFNRRPYPWNNPCEDLRSHYSKIGKIRTKHSVYADGEFELLEISSDLLVFSRSNGNCNLITIVNNSNDEKFIEFSCPCRELIHEKRSIKHRLQPTSAYVFDASMSDYYKIN